jgi:serine/threonine protein kinase
MVDNGENSDIKLVDFGLSKTFGPGETCTEPYGTLCYVAPEILMQLPYDKAVDCWSFGIIIYLMLGRHLPFDSQDDKEIGRKTIYKEISFNHPVWSTVSAEGKDIISKLLIKNRKERITIKDALDHPWMHSADTAISQLRRKSIDTGDKLLQFVAYSQHNMNSIKDST